MSLIEAYLDAEDAPAAQESADVKSSVTEDVAEQLQGEPTQENTKRTASRM